MCPFRNHTYIFPFKPVGLLVCLPGSFKVAVSDKSNRSANEYSSESSMPVRSTSANRRANQLSHLADSFILVEATVAEAEEAVPARITYSSHYSSQSAFPLLPTAPKYPFLCRDFVERKLFLNERKRPARLNTQVCAQKMC